MLDIRVLGTGCAGCLKMEQTVMEALHTLGISEAQVTLVTEERMIEYGLLGDRAPGLLINGKLAWAGSAPTKAQVVQWLQHACKEAIHADDQNSWTRMRELQAAGLSGRALSESSGHRGAH